MATKIKALVLQKPGGWSNLMIREVAKPRPRPGEVLVRVFAAALNHRDLWIVEGQYAGIRYPAILGSDGCGVVERTGSMEDGHWIGKEVIINPAINWGPDPRAQSNDFEILGMPRKGTFAEYVVVPSDRLAVKPEHLSYAEAAALPLAGLTAYRAVFTQADVQKGDKVLITGIGGGVAQMAFLFAKTVGAEVWVTTGSEWKLARALENGAAGGVNYREAQWDAQLLRETGGFDVIIDSAGGDQLNTLLKLLKPGRILVTYGATLGKPSGLDLHRIFWRQLCIQGTTMGNDEEFAEMVEFVQQHRIKPVIDTVYAFDQILEAFDVMRRGMQFGKLVVEFQVEDDFFRRRRRTPKAAEVSTAKEAAESVTEAPAEIPEQQETKKKKTATKKKKRAQQEKKRATKKTKAATAGKTKKQTAKKTTKTTKSSTAKKRTTAKKASAKKSTAKKQKKQEKK